MKAIAISFCLAATFAQIVSAQNVTTPTSHIELFNGTNFDGFTFCMRNDADPMQTWSVTNSVIHCNGSAIGYLRTKQSYSNYVVTVEWRFRKVTPKANNTGVLVHMQLPDAVWPMCIQNQGKSGRQGDLFVMAGAECKEHKGQDANTPVAMFLPPNENLIGEWNTNATVCRNDDVEAHINGKYLNEIRECTISSGFVGIQSEGADFEIRKIFLEPAEFFKVITDAQAGQYAIVNSDKQTVSLKDKTGNVVWSTNVAYLLTEPTDGERKIYSMQLYSNELQVQVGHAVVQLDKQTGKITGADVH
jgi:hypothetical protein